MEHITHLLDFLPEKKELLNENYPNIIMILEGGKYVLFSEGQYPV